MSTLTKRRYATNKRAAKRRATLPPEHVGPRWYRWGIDNLDDPIEWNYIYGSPADAPKQSLESGCYMVSEPIDYPPLEWLEAENDRMSEEERRVRDYQDLVWRTLATARHVMAKAEP
jgi:hypothetical protein